MKIGGCAFVRYAFFLPAILDSAAADFVPRLSVRPCFCTQNHVDRIREISTFARKLVLIARYVSLYISPAAFDIFAVIKSSNRQLLSFCNNSDFLLLFLLQIVILLIFLFNANI